jgi:hypothetical protein
LTPTVFLTGRPFVFIKLFRHFPSGRYDIPKVKSSNFLSLGFGKIALLAIAVSLSVGTEELRAQGTLEAVNTIGAPPLIVSNILLSTEIYGNNSTVGWVFSSSQNLTVSSLGGLLASSLPQSSGTITIGLWSADGTLLSSTVLGKNSVTVNGSLYQPISPISIIAGNTYIIAAGSSGTFGFADLPDSQAQSPLTYLGVAAVTGNGFSLPTIYPTSSIANQIYGATFLFQTVPEPGPLALAAVGALWVALRRGKTTS